MRVSHERCDLGVSSILGDGTMYKTVYQDKYGRLIVRERSYTLTLFNTEYHESDPLPVPIERMRPAHSNDRLSEFVEEYVAEHPNSDLLARLTKTA
jgi:hypothetical protein